MKTVKKMAENGHGCITQAWMARAVSTLGKAAFSALFLPQASAKGP